MSLRRETLADGEYYHVYNRGAHKREIFNNPGDYFRFQLMLHLSNTDDRIVMRDLLESYKGRSFVEIFEEVEVSHSLVDVLAYCLMPNHFHLILRQKSKDGISHFMKKLATSYSMYFNTKYECSGTLFQGRFQSKHVADESYFRWLFAYVHFNPLKLVEPKWKEEGVQNPLKTKAFLASYHHSSYVDYCVTARSERVIFAFQDAPDFIKIENDFEDLLHWHESGNEIGQVI